MASLRLQHNAIARDDLRDTPYLQPHRTLAGRAKMLGDAIRNSSVQMTSDPMDAITFFQKVDHLFETYEVPNELRVYILRPYLFDVELQSLRHLDPTSLSNYNVVKNHIMNQLQLTPKYFLQSKYFGVIEIWKYVHRKKGSRTKSIMAPVDRARPETGRKLLPKASSRWFSSTDSLRFSNFPH